MESSTIKRELFAKKPFLFPNKNADNSWQNGTLEDLAIELLKEQYANEIISKVLLEKSAAHLNELENARGNSFSRLHKNMLHTVFAGTDKYVGLKLGEAAKAGAFDWEREKLEALKQFLFQLVK